MDPTTETEAISHGESDQNPTPDKVDTPSDPVVPPKRPRGRPRGSGTKAAPARGPGNQVATSDVEEDIDRAAIKKFLLKKKIKKYIRFYMDKEERQRQKPNYYHPAPSLYQQEMDDVDMDDAAESEKSNDEEDNEEAETTTPQAHAHGAPTRYNNPTRAPPNNRFRSLIFRH